MSLGWILCPVWMKVFGCCILPIFRSSNVKCRADEDVEEVFRRPEYKDFDQLPITEGSRIIGIA